MSNRPLTQRTLDKLIESARSEPTLSIDFERMQVALRQAWIGRRATERHLPVRWHWVSAVAVAGSFLIGGWYGHASHMSLTSPDIASHRALHALDGRTLAIGQDLSAVRESLVVEHPGIARWSLAPGGKATLAAKGQYLTIRLNVGRIDAEVVPSRQPESFAVEAGSLRIAVHGTTFTVEKHAEFVVVSVRAGTVVVGFASQPGQTIGSLLDAPRTERFAIAPNQDRDPAAKHDESPPGPVPSRPKMAGTSSVSLAANASDESSAHVDTRLNDHPSRVEQEVALDAVRAAAEKCFTQAKNNEPTRDSHVVVQVDTQLTITIAPSGSIADASFAPPVPESILACTLREMSDWLTSPSKLGSSASRPIMLTR